MLIIHGILCGEGGERGKERIKKEKENTNGGNLSTDLINVIKRFPTYFLMRLADSVSCCREGKKERKKGRKGKGKYQISGDERSQ